jgi:putative oxidoreductase
VVVDNPLIRLEAVGTDTAVVAQMNIPRNLQFGAMPLAARLLLTAEFLVAVNGKIFGWSGQAAYMAAHGMTMIAPLLAAALVIEAAGSVCLITGIQARAAGAVMCIYLGIVSVRLHDFWNQSAGMSGMNATEFFKNLGMMGGLLMIAVYGPGLWTVDRLWKPSTAVDR